MWIIHYKDGTTINELMQPEFTELDKPEDITSLQLLREGTFFTVSRLNNSHRLIMQKIGVGFLDPQSGKQGQKQTGHRIYCVYSPMGDAEGWLLDWANGVIQRIYFNIYQKGLNLELFKVNHRDIRFGARPALTIYNFKQIIPHKEWEEQLEIEVKDKEGKKIKKKITATFAEDLPFWECRVCHQLIAATIDDCMYCGMPHKEEEEQYLNKGKKRIK